MSVELRKQRRAKRISQFQRLRIGIVEAAFEFGPARTGVVKGLKQGCGKVLEDFFMGALRAGPDCIEPMACRNAKRIFAVTPMAQTMLRLRSAERRRCGFVPDRRLGNMFSPITIVRSQ